MDGSSAGYSTVEFNVSACQEETVGVSGLPQESNITQEQSNYAHQSYMMDPVGMKQEAIPSTSSALSPSFTASDRSVVPTDSVIYSSYACAGDSRDFSSSVYSSDVDVSNSATGVCMVNSINTGLPSNESHCNEFSSNTFDAKFPGKFQFHQSQQLHNEYTSSTSHQMYHDNLQGSKECEKEFPNYQNSSVELVKDEHVPMDVRHTLNSSNCAKICQAVYKPGECSEMLHSTKPLLYENETQNHGARFMPDPFIVQTSSGYPGLNAQSKDLKSGNSLSLNAAAENPVTNNSTFNSLVQNPVYEVTTACVVEENKSPISSSNNITAIDGGNNHEWNDSFGINTKNELTIIDSDALSGTSCESFSENVSPWTSRKQPHNVCDFSMKDEADDVNSETSTDENIETVVTDGRTSTTILSESEGKKCEPASKDEDGLHVKRDYVLSEDSEDTSRLEHHSVMCLQKPDNLSTGEKEYRSDKINNEEADENESDFKKEPVVFDGDVGSANTNTSRKQASPPTTNFSLLENQVPSTSGTTEDHGNDAATKSSPECVRITRARTGTLPTRRSRLAEEESDLSDGSYSDLIPNEDWEYVEGAESAPSIVHPSISAPDSVLKIVPEEMTFYETMFRSGIDAVLRMHLHCTICDRHIGAAPNYIHLGNQHKVLRVLICNRCRAFYDKGIFPRDSDGSELYCRWCGQGGQVICCSHCPNVFCKGCLKRNFGSSRVRLIEESDDWSCVVCNYQELWQLRGICWALLKYTMGKKRDVLFSNNNKKMIELEEDKSRCCSHKNHRKKKASYKGKISMSSGSAQNQVLIGEDVTEDFMSGHFLFGNFENENDSHSDVTEDSYFDPSQFVQPVLEEESSPRLSQAPKCRVPEIVNVRSIPPRQPKILRLQPIPALQCIAPAPVRMPRPQSVINQSPVRYTSSRSLLGQSRLSQTGLMPINRQQNSVSVSSMVLLNDQGKPHPARIITGTGTSTRPQTTSNIQTVDGVRSLEQLRSLATVEWFRDGIDSMRAVGFAVSKRLRELEARFHSLKSKDDFEKVMILGKKLERLGRRTEFRYNKINTELKQGCRNWIADNARKKGRLITIPSNMNPFQQYSEPFSDWEDDVELSKPLEKVLIPVSTSSLRGNTLFQPRFITNVNPNRPPPPLVSNVVRMRHSPPVPRLVCLPSSSAPRQILARSIIRPRMITSSSLNQAASQIRPLGPGLIGFLNNTSIVDSIGNSVSISITSSKRKQEDSDGDVELYYPTIPKLMQMHKIRPCSVRLERCDELIESILQEQASKYSEYFSDCEELGKGKNVNVVDDRRLFQVSKTHERSKVVSQMVDDDDDDDIQIIEEVKITKEVNSAKGKHKEDNPLESNPREINSMEMNPMDNPVEMNRMDNSVELNPREINSMEMNPMDNPVEMNPREIYSVDVNPMDNPVEMNPRENDSMEMNPREINFLEMNPMDVNSMNENSMSENPIDENFNDVNPIAENFVDIHPPNMNPMYGNSMDANSMDENPVDTNSMDENPMETNSVDENPLDTNSIDENSLVTNSMDENPLDTNSMDENPVDTNSTDENPKDINSTGENPVEMNSMDDNAICMNSVDDTSIDLSSMDENPINMNPMYEDPLNINHLEVNSVKVNSPEELGSSFVSFRKLEDSVIGNNSL